MNTADALHMDTGNILKATVIHDLRGDSEDGKT